MTPIVAAEYEGAVFLLPTDADERLFVNRNRKDLRILGRAVATVRAAGRVEGDTFVDVGAHVGTTTIAAVTVHGFSRAVAIEPDPANVRLLRANTALNELEERVRVVAAGISDAPGSAWFLPGDPERGPAYWTKGNVVAEPADGALRVDLVTLEQLAGRGELVPEETGLLWLDCQKREEQALRAASPFLERRVPVVFALRRMHLSTPASLLDVLAERYDSFVDLRRKDPLDRRAPWTAVVEPLDELVERRAAKKALTDVLAF
jgi:FkbM family methyltransferase